MSRFWAHIHFNPIYTPHAQAQCKSIYLMQKKKKKKGNEKKEIKK
jgi:hypothetical protein